MLIQCVESSPLLPLEDERKLVKEQKKKKIERMDIEESPRYFACLGAVRRNKVTQGGRKTNVRK